MSSIFPSRSGCHDCMWQYDRKRNVKSNCPDTPPPGGHQCPGWEWRYD